MSLIQVVAEAFLRLVGVFVALVFFTPLEGSAKRARANYQPKESRAHGPLSESISSFITEAMTSIGSFFRMMALTKRNFGWKAVWGGITPGTALYIVLFSIKKDSKLSEITFNATHLSGVLGIVQSYLYLPNIMRFTMVYLLTIPFKVLADRCVIR